jgi:hypothetical protein
MDATEMRNTRHFAKAADIERAIAECGTTGILVALMAATGLRLPEALSLFAGGEFGMRESYYDATRALIHIQQSTRARCTRDVYLTAAFNDWLQCHLKLTFSRQQLKADFRRFNIPPAFAFRHFRVVHLRSCGVQESVLMRQIGHMRQNPRDEEEERLTRAEVERCGVGFAF